MAALAHANRPTLGAVMSRFVLATGLVLIGASKFALLAADATNDALIPLPWLLAIGALECLVAVGLLRKPGTATAGVALAMSMTFLVSTVVLSATLSDLDSCGCFGPWRASAGVHLATALGLVVLSVSVYLDEVRRRGGPEAAPVATAG